MLPVYPETYGAAQGLLNKLSLTIEETNQLSQKNNKNNEVTKRKLIRKNESK